MATKSPLNKPFSAKADNVDYSKNGQWRKLIRGKALIETDRSGTCLYIQTSLGVLHHVCFNDEDEDDNDHGDGGGVNSNSQLTKQQQWQQLQQQ